MAKKPLKMFKVNNISEVRDVDALYCIKTATDTEFSIVVTDAFGAIVNLKDLQTPAGIQGIASDDGTIEVTGTAFKNLKLSATLVDAINNALKETLNKFCQEVWIKLKKPRTKPNHQVAKKTTIETNILGNFILSILFSLAKLNCINLNFV